MGDDFIHQGLVQVFFEILARCRTTQRKVSCRRARIEIFISQVSSHSAVKKIGFYSNLIATQKYTSSQKNWTFESRG